MSVTNFPTDIVISDMDRQCIETYNERQRRQFLGSKARALGVHGVSLVSQAAEVSIDTVYRGLHELESKANDNFPKGRVRKVGGGRKPTLVKYPELLKVFDEIAESYTAGLPQDPDVIWLTIPTSQIVTIFKERNLEVSPYLVRQMKSKRGFKDRSFTKSLTMKEVKDRNAQFEKIRNVLKGCEANDVPVLSIDTKKKEMLGNFKRSGRVSAKGGAPKSYDHDFKTFSSGIIIPHGIYDVGANTGYLTLGTSHDTPKFVCDNLEYVWCKYLQWKYPRTKTICIICDGGGSNSSSHHVVKQALLKLSASLGLNIIVLHYPPYCSKYNPIEHCMFGPISRSWSGAPFFSIEDARQRAENTVTSKGLSIIANINQRTYETNRPIEPSYEEEKSKRIIFDDSLPKWNYVIKPA